MKTTLKLDLNTDPRELPILFTDEMVRAILARRKRVTRRLKCRYRVGDLLYVREAVRLYAGYTEVCVQYRADSSQRLVKDPPHLHGPGFHIALANELSDFADFNARHPYRWRGNILMPKAASRIQLRVTDIHEEPLQAITEEQAEAEGADNYREGAPTGAWGEYRISFRQAFAELWNQINNEPGRRWEDNPTNFAISFEIVRIDPTEHVDLATEDEEGKRIDLELAQLEPGDTE